MSIAAAAAIALAALLFGLAFIVALSDRKGEDEWLSFALVTSASVCLFYGLHWL